MLKRHLLLCLVSTLFATASMAAEDAKPAAAPTLVSGAKPVEATAKADVSDAKSAALARKRARWSQAGLDLTHCLSKETNAAVIRCAE